MVSCGAEVLLDRAPECGLAAGAWNVRRAEPPIRAIGGPLDQAELADIPGQGRLGGFDAALRSFSRSCSWLVIASAQRVPG